LPLQFELATRIPLIIKVPWKTSSIGRRTVALVEAVDFYKTLVGLAGLPPPASIGEQLNGTSLEPLFDDPTNRSFSPAAFSQFAKDDTFSVENKFYRNQTKLMGCVPRDLPPPPSPQRRCRRVQRSRPLRLHLCTYAAMIWHLCSLSWSRRYTVRVDEWRYTVWFAFDDVAIRPIRNQVLGRELYDHRGDTNLWLDFPGENRNVVGAPENAPIADRLHRQVLDYIRL